LLRLLKKLFSLENIRMSFTNKDCFLGQTNKSIFEYVVDNSMYVNQNECDNFTPPFLTYMPGGIKPKNVDIETDLKGISRVYSKCQSCKYQPTQNPIKYENKKECASSFKIREQYINKN